MHLEAIGSERQKIFQKLKEFRGFYLVGGTALALQIGHRVSIDFDLFSNKKISPNLLDKVGKVFKNSKISIVVNNPDQLSVKIDGIKIDFVGYPFLPILGFINYEGVNILKISEIAAMKANVLGRRPSLKDYIDLYFILKEKYIDLNGIINIAEKKYKEEFNGRLFLEQLIYLQDVKEMEISFLKESVSRQQLQEFFEKEIESFKIPKL